MEYTAGNVVVCTKPACRIQVQGFPDAEAIKKAAVECPDVSVRAVFILLEEVIGGGISGKAPSFLESFFADVPVFRAAVYRLLLNVPRGRVISYQGLAEAAGAPGAARAAASAMRQNPLPVLIPCHRVVCADGRPGGYSGIADNPLKVELLENEGIILEEGKIPLRYYCT